MLTMKCQAHHWENEYHKDMDALNVSVFEANIVSRVNQGKSLHVDHEESDKYIFSTVAQHWENEYHKDICG